MFRSWFLGTPEGEHVSMAVYSDGAYGVASDIFYSFPVHCQNGDWQIVDGLETPDVIQKKMKETEQELLDEKSECGL